jgi:hypothetical protein
VLQPRPPRASEAAGRAAVIRDASMWLVVVLEFILVLPNMQPDRAAVGTSALLGCPSQCTEISRKRQQRVDERFI